MRYSRRARAFDARTASREEMMDRHPWTYQVMADEMIREEKITEERKPGQAINDLRNYVYFDIRSNQTGAALSVAVKLKGDPVWRASDWGIANYRIDRSGNFRTTALLPKRARLEEIERVVARCDVKGDPRAQSELSQVPSTSCDLRSINKIFVLDDAYMPGEPLKLLPAVKNRLRRDGRNLQHQMCAFETMLGKIIGANESMPAERKTMSRHIRLYLITLLFAAPISAQQSKRAPAIMKAGMKAGFAKIVITPEQKCTGCPVTRTAQNQPRARFTTFTPEL